MNEAAGLEAINLPALSQWFLDHIPGSETPLQLKQISGGYSNLTFEITLPSGATYILRRPPLKKLSKTAHDVKREYRILLALAGTGLPIPAVASFCPDTAIIGSEFYLMKKVAGEALHNRAVMESYLDDAAKQKAGQEIVDVLVDLHNIDPMAQGLGKLGPGKDFLKRQIRGWFKENHSPAIRELKDQLLTILPPQSETTLVHSDWRLGNCLFDQAGRITAILDWETCTLGDPLADLAFLVALWTHPEDEFPKDDAPSNLSLMPRQQDLIERYANKSGRNMAMFPFHLAFQYWRSACIFEDLCARYKDRKPERVDALMEKAANYIEAADKQLKSFTR